MNQTITLLNQTIALLSQPNVGKSTLFNGLTGSHQHVGNWPGKTVEKKSGTFSHNGKSYTVMDLPGSYSLSANSDEEIVTRDYISNDDCGLVCIMADASQLERSLFMLSDYCGIHKPAMLILNMIDVAKAQGKTINVRKLEEKLGIPVIAMSAAFTKKYDDFYKALDRVMEEPKVLDDTGLSALYEEFLGEPYKELIKLLPSSGKGTYSPVWLAVKLIENDAPAIEMAKNLLDEADIQKLETILAGINNGSLKTGECKFNWINNLLIDVVDRNQKQGKYKLNWFDRLMTKRFWGKSIALLSLLIGLILSIGVGMPIMGIGLSFPVISQALHTALATVSAPAWVVSLLADAMVAVFGYTVAMAGLVLGITFVFGLLEEIGFMARVSYAFDNTFSKMGLQGKSIMPLIVSFGCNMGGAYSCRVIDTWGQKALTTALSWAIPCMGCWGVIGLLSGIYFGSNTFLVIAALFAVIIFHIWLTAKIFRPKLIPKENQAGLIMELPPYHKPKWGPLLRYVFGRFLHVFWKAFKMVSIITLVVWLLSGMGSGDVTNSILYKIGKFCEPVTSIFGLKWQFFIAWVTSVMGKEATLGVFSALFTASNGIFVTNSMAAGTASGLANAMSQVISKPEALAFIFAFTFNVPCLMTVGATNTELHSLKWTLRITLYYTVSALIYAFIAYHIGLLIW